MRVNITAALMSKLNVLSSEYNIEVGGYLTGETKNGELYLDDLLIPNQRITTGSVEINTNDQVELFRRYGSRCKRIVGHWHSHHSMGCFWSGVDRNNMSNIMEYKDLFVFIVSSLGNHKVKICMKNPLNIEFDDCDLYLRTVMLDQLRTRMKTLMGENRPRSYHNANLTQNLSIEEKMDAISQKVEKEMLDNDDDEIVEEGQEEETEEASYYG